MTEIESELLYAGMLWDDENADQAIAWALGYYRSSHNKTPQAMRIHPTAKFTEPVLMPETGETINVTRYYPVLPGYLYIAQQ